MPDSPTEVVAVFEMLVDAWSNGTLESRSESCSLRSLCVQSANFSSRCRPRWSASPEGIDSGVCYLTSTLAVRACTMKIVYVNDVVYAYGTGDPLRERWGGRYGWYLTRALANAGWSVTIGVQHALQEGEERQIDGVRFLGIGRRVHFLLAWYRFLEENGLIGASGSVRTISGVLPQKLRDALEFIRLFRRCTIWTYEPQRALTRRKNWWPLYEWGLRRSDIIFVQHGGQRAQLPQTGRPGRTCCRGSFPLPVSYTPHPERNGTVAWVAVIRPPKRPDLLVEIARRLPAVHFVVCGAPQYTMWRRGEIKV